MQEWLQLNGNAKLRNIRATFCQNLMKLDFSESSN